MGFAHHYPDTRYDRDDGGLLEDAAFSPEHLQQIREHCERNSRQMNRILGLLNQIGRHIQRRVHQQDNPDSPLAKRRVPRVCKSLSAPGWGEDFLRRAVAIGDNPAALRRLCEAERAKGNMEF